MLLKLIAMLKYEMNLLEKLNKVAMEQQTALIEYKIDQLDRLAAEQQELAAKLHDAEKQRISMVKLWLNISTREAATMKLSALERKLDPRDIHEFQKVRVSLRSLMTNLHYTNTTNRVLNKRARNTISSIISFFTNGTNHICNVKI
jgi:predicted metalloendopeptidase